ncbi:MAG: hypothetical protein EOM50_12005 [Erysipelotrichia bacterium]|nr:hypothetical protein [Erysipelotrichia bacterium]
MSIRIPSEKLFVKVWSVDVKDNFVRGRGTTSDKNKDGTYRNSSWDLIFCGACKDLAAELTGKELIIVSSGKVTHELYEDKVTKEFKSPNPTIVIFDFEKYTKDNNLAPQNSKKESEMPY